MSREVRALGPLKHLMQAHTRRRLVGLLALLVVAQLLALAPPYLIKLVIDDAIVPARPDRLWLIALVGIALYALTALVGYWSRWLSDWYGEQLWLDLRNRLFGHLQGLSLRYHNGHRIGDLVSRVYSDAYYANHFVTSILPGAVGLVVGVGGTGVILLWLAPRLTLLALIPVPAALLIGAIIRRHVRPLSRKKMELHGDLYSTLHESLQGIEEIKLYREEATFAGKLDAQGRALMDVEMRLSKAKARLFPLLDFGISTMMLVALALGGFMVIDGALTVGTLVVYYYYIARSLGPIRSASSMVFGWHGAAAAFERIDELLACDERLPEPANPRRLDEGPVHVRFEAVTFHYTDLETGEAFCALDGVELDVVPGAKIAILGPSGSGKSTTGKLIARLFDPDEGRITFNGIALGELALDDLRGRIGYVGQEVFLFNGTIEQNVRFGAADDVTDEEVERVVRTARVDEFAARKHERLQTEVGEGGVRLSGGQKKRIALARALLRRPRILIIDQIASDLEEGLNRSIFEAIARDYQMTIVYLGHRVPAGLEPDAVYWMENGQLAPRALELEAGGVRGVTERAIRAGANELEE